MSRRLNTIGCLLVAIAGSCSHTRYSHYEPATPPAGRPQARLFLVGDAGIVSFEEAQVEKQAKKGKRRVERQLPPWAKPRGGEKKVFKDIVDEVVGLAVKSARQSHLLQTLKGEALNRRFLEPGAVPLIVWLGD